MSLTTSFNDSYTGSKRSDAVLLVYHDSLCLYYDFNARVLTTLYGNNAPAVTPFSQLDPESLIAMRDKLVAEGGHPPEWPPVSEPRPPQNKLNV